MDSYRQAVERYAVLRRQLADAQIAYDKLRHTLRNEMYNAKINSGVKYTEEHIRSASIAACQEEKERYELALADCEVAAAWLEFHKQRATGTNKKD